MEEKKREFIIKAAGIYMKYGIKSLTMDEMARQLGVSKKTLYQYVKDKNELVELCISLQHEDEQQMIAEIVGTSDNAIEQMLRISRVIIEKLRNIHPSIFFDLAKYHPSAMKLMDCQKEEFICGSIAENVVVGIKQGIYRKNLNPEIISAIYVGMIDLMMTDKIFHLKMKPDEIYSEMFRYHIRGIASEKGLKSLAELIKNDESLSYGM
jgi:TetR/AcrR family transcriptional regulator, cholesterol catabolism regulator